MDETEKRLEQRSQAMKKYTVYLLVESMAWTDIEAENQDGAILKMAASTNIITATEGLHDAIWQLVAVEEKTEVLFSTFITGAEILEWTFTGNETLHSALVDEAYARWCDKDRETAQYYAGVWTGSVEAQPGGYYVWLEAEEE